MTRSIDRHDLSELEDFDVLLCTALLRGTTYPEAAKVAGCSRSTVARRMSDPTFRRRLDQLRIDAFARTTDRIVAEAMASVESISDIRSDANAPVSVRLRAAIALLELSLKYRTASDLDDRLRSIEEILLNRSQS